MKIIAALLGRSAVRLIAATVCLTFVAQNASANIAVLADKVLPNKVAAIPTIDLPLRLAALGDTDADAQSRTGRYSLLVRQIQLRLAEIGVYEGPIGGIMSPETGDAIRQYQNLASLLIDGRPTDALLEHLTSAAGAAQHLLLRLDRARQQQIVDAKTALEKEFGSEWAELPAEPAEIGRASCRERV